MSDSVEIPVAVLREWYDRARTPVHETSHLIIQRQKDVLAERIKEYLPPPPPEPVVALVEPARWTVLCQKCKRYQRPAFAAGYASLIWDRHDLGLAQQRPCRTPGCGALLAIPALPKEGTE